MEQTQRTSADLHLHPRQAEAFDLLDRPEVKELLYGGAKGGGKSIAGCVWCAQQARRIIDEFDLKPTKHPRPVGFMGRKRSVDFTDTTLETWKQWIPEEIWRISPVNKEIIIQETVKINYGGMDDEKTVNKFNSAEFAFFFLDQAEEIALDLVATLRGTLRLKIKGKDIPSKVLFTANPAQCWLKSEFIDSPKPNHRFVRALPTDNPFLHADYIEQLKEAFSYRPEVLAAYLDGSWTALAGFSVIIQDAWIQAAKQRVLHSRRPRPFLVCDPARFGDDETVIYLMYDTDIIDEMIYGQKDTMFTANTLHISALQNEVSAVIVDEIGVGGGVVDRLREMSGSAYDVIGINAAAKSSEPKKYFNVRAEMWYKAATMLAEGDVELTHDDTELERQLTTPTFSFRGTRILVQPKDEIKKELGRSPDRGDCYVMGLYGRQFVSDRDDEAEREVAYRRRRQKQDGTTAMAS